MQDWRGGVVACLYFLLLFQECPIMLTINNLTYRIQGRELFEDASVVLPTGSKTGFVGKNGTGKTTLFHLIQGHLAPDAGSIELNRKARIGAVAQEAPAGNESVLDVVLSADKERTAPMFVSEGAEVDVWPCDLGELLTNRMVTALWHPKTGARFTATPTPEGGG